MGYIAQESLENTPNTMGTLLGVHPISWVFQYQMGLMNTRCGFDQADYYKLLDVDDFASVKDIKGHMLSLFFFLPSVDI